ncbi:Severin [Madurella mycetomatis]|uniref:Severin n=1 Tax=Madurella mycetomatis TaxID=100816 RepID=A0A175WAV9_9PEZI|nr:Severin [Madurella mycetomatis]
MAPNRGIVHFKEYNVEDSNVELIGNFELSKTDPDNSKLLPDIYFYLGAHTSQDEAGTAAYKTVELDAFLHGAATQHREVQSNPSAEFLALFPRVTVRRGGVASGFRHVELADGGSAPSTPTLLRVFRHPASSASSTADAMVVYEVEPTWRGLDEGDVFILEEGAKIWVWQGRACSPIEKAKTAQVVHDMRLDKRAEVEVLSQTEPRSRVVVKMLGGGDEDGFGELRAERPVVGVSSKAAAEQENRRRRLFRLSDETGQLQFGLVRDAGDAISRSDLDGDDVYLLDSCGKAIWVWEGQNASSAEKTMWLRAAQGYVRRLQDEDPNRQAYLTPIAKVREGSESPAFLRAIEVMCAAGHGG